MTFALILAKVGSFLSAVAWWVWLLLAVFIWGFYGHHELNSERASRKAEIAAQAKKIKELQDEKIAIEAKWSAKYASIDEDRKREVHSAVASRDTALAELRKRPARHTNLPGPSTAACSGASGAELAGSDAQFLERYAAVARGFQIALAACQARETVR